MGAFLFLSPKETFFLFLKMSSKFVKVHHPSQITKKIILFAINKIFFLFAKSKYFSKIFSHPSVLWGFNDKLTPHTFRKKSMSIFSCAFSARSSFVSAKLSEVLEVSPFTSDTWLSASSNSGAPPPARCSWRALGTAVTHSLWGLQMLRLPTGSSVTSVPLSSALSMDWRWNFIKLKIRLKDDVQKKIVKNGQIYIFNKNRNIMKNPPIGFSVTSVPLSSYLS
jgi:hypothetical protein